MYIYIHIMYLYTHAHIYVYNMCLYIRTNSFTLHSNLVRHLILLSPLSSGETSRRRDENPFLCLTFCKQQSLDLFSGLHYQP